MPDPVPPPVGPTGFLVGLTFPFRGFFLLASAPQLWKYVILPFAINFAVMTAVLWLTIENWDAWIGYFTPERTAWYHHILYWGVWALAAALATVLFVFAATFVGTLIAAPFNDLLVRKTIKTLDGAEAPDLPFTFEVVLRDVGRSAAHSFLNLGLWAGLQVILLAVNFLVPVVGTVIYLVLSNLTTFLFQAHLHLDLPMSVYRWGWRQKWALIWAHRWPLCGFGLTTTLLPCVNYLFLPIWVMSGTVAFRAYHPYVPEKSA